ncbi:MAG: hypothetical protein QOF89_596 [Acidobacteriota bacterium]|jgi:hypothetical protein|nr:hypothetical protein [Acidobacteriota bacterium]
MSGLAVGCAVRTVTVDGAHSAPYKTVLLVLPSFSLFSRSGGGRWEKRAGVMRGAPGIFLLDFGL